MTDLPNENRRNISSMEKCLGKVEQKLDDSDKNNSEEHEEIKAGIKDVILEVRNLGDNYIVFKTKILAYWGIGIVALSAVINRLIDNI